MIGKNLAQRRPPVVVAGHQAQRNPHPGEQGPQPLVFRHAAAVDQVTAQHQQVGRDVKRGQVVDAAGQALRDIDARTVTIPRNRHMKVGKLRDHHRPVGACGCRHPGVDICLSVT